MKENCKKYEVIIVGGGLAGLTAAILLNRLKISVLLIEKKQYPFHRVCGEYVSNEIKEFLKHNELFPKEIQPSEINKFLLSSVNGKSNELDLDLGGFGISRYEFDNYLYQKAHSEGVDFLFDEVTNVVFDLDHFVITTKSNDILESELAIGAYGKRSKLDQDLNRRFIKNKSPYIGVKYHIRNDKYARDTVALHNFYGGYCGINAIEGDKLNFCYLSHRTNLYRYKNISLMEQEILYKNPLLKQIFNESEFLFEKPEVINEISFSTKGPIENHMLMAGDASGMITPLCGNGMAMAIHAAKLLVDEIMNFKENHNDRKKLEMRYSQKWNDEFKSRLAFGRIIQSLFGASLQSDIAIKMLSVKPLANLIIKSTHGKPIAID